MEYSGNLEIKSASITGIPTELRHINKSLEFRNIYGAPEWVYINISYPDDLQRINESTLRVWRDSEGWTNCTEPWAEACGINQGENYVFSNITEFSTFAVLGDFLNCTDEDGDGPTGVIGECAELASRI